MDVGKWLRGLGNCREGGETGSFGELLRCFLVIELV